MCDTIQIFLIHFRKKFNTIDIGRIQFMSKILFSGNIANKFILYIISGLKMLSKVKNDSY